MKSLVFSKVIYIKKRGYGMTFTFASYEKVIGLLSETHTPKVHTLILLMLLDVGWRCGTTLLIRQFIRKDFPESSRVIIPLFTQLKEERKFTDYISGEVKSVWHGMKVLSSDKAVLREAVQCMFPDNHTVIFPFIK